MGVKILVADDERMVRRFFRAVIAQEKLPVDEILEADNGDDAVSLARERRPDLCFLDIRMPGLDGLQATAQIARQAGGEIIILSAYSEFEYARTAFRAGAGDYLLKPVKPAEIAAAIRKAAGGPAAARPSAPSAGIAPPLVRAVAAYVEKHLREPLPLQDIAKAVFVSPYHLSRTFKQLTGQPLTDYIQEKRLIRAVELLRATDAPITEVAWLAGFKDASYFSTCFKHKMGLTPLQYRKRQGN